MSIIQNRSVVKASPSKLGTSGARLSDTPHGRPVPAPKTHAKSERTVLQGLKQVIYRDLNAEREALEEWSDEYSTNRAKIESNLRRQREALATLADWE